MTNAYFSCKDGKIIDIPDKNYWTRIKKYLNLPIPIDTIHAFEDQGDGTYKIVALNPDGSISK